MTEEWLIDGYNVLHDFASRKGSGLPRERGALLLALASLAGPSRRILVVFDGVGNDDEFAAFRTASFEVLHSQKVPADAYIERRFTQKTDRRSTVVVTRDRAIVTLARGAGARVSSPDDLAALLRDAARSREEDLFRHRVRGRGFHRPFEDKLGGGA